MKNKTNIAFKRKEKASKDWKTFRGHTRLVYRATKRWANGCKKPIAILSQRDFLAWSFYDHLSGYPFIYNQWEKADYPDDSPVITRHTTKKGYFADNLIWVTKELCGLTKRQLAEKAAAAEVDGINAKNRIAREEERNTKYAADAAEYMQIQIKKQRRLQDEIRIQRR